MIAPLIRLTIGDWLYRCPGYFKTMTTTIDNTYPWEINLEKDNEKTAQLPHVVQISLSFTVIGDGPHTSAVGTEGNEDLVGIHIGGGVLANTNDFFDSLQHIRS
jgi:hypothetical protein